MSKDIISNYKQLVDDRLQLLLNSKPTLYEDVRDAMRYSVSIGGKRIRPCLLMEFADICGGDREDASNIAAALEMVHTYSLIHDDLPCMDNDDMRRGMPSCHKKFGEDIALLAGDALLTLAFNVISTCKNSNPDNILKCVNILSDFAGVDGMVGGQVIDLQSEEKRVDDKTLLQMCTLKTARLIQAACLMGCVISNASEEEQKAAFDFGYNLGVAFQIVDDILDVTSTTEELGKPIGSDSQNNKSTFVSTLGLDTARKLANEYTEKAIESLKPFGETANLLKDFTIDILDRRN